MRIPAASPRKKHNRNSHGDVPSQRSSMYPSAVPMTTATTNDNPTALSAPRLRSVRPLSVPSFGDACCQGLAAGSAVRRVSCPPAPRRRRTRQPRTCSAAACLAVFGRGAGVAPHRQAASATMSTMPTRTSGEPAPRRRTSSARSRFRGHRETLYLNPARVSDKRARAGDRAAVRPACVQSLASWPQVASARNSFGAPTSLTGLRSGAHTQVKPRECPGDARPGPRLVG